MSNLMAYDASFLARTPNTYKISITNDVGVTIHRCFSIVALLPEAVILDKILLHRAESGPRSSYLLKAAISNARQLYTGAS